MQNDQQGTTESRDRQVPLVEPDQSLSSRHDSSGKDDPEEFEVSFLGFKLKVKRFTVKAIIALIVVLLFFAFLLKI